MNKIIVIGNGYIGSKLAKDLIEDKNEDILHLYKYDYDNPKVLNDTLFNTLHSYLNNNKKNSEEPIWVVNCVGYTGKPNVDACEEEKEKCWALNVTFPTLLANVCLKHNVKLINVSSGCIYSGDNVYEEEDWPDFGVDSPDSSWYSRTKHAAELSLNAFPNVYTLRIRMPICADFNSGKNYLTKILKYNDLLQEVNSKTVIPDLLKVIYKIINMQDIPTGIYNVVNPEPMDTKSVTEILDKNGMWNPHWKFINYNDLKKHIKANRSNCKLSTEKSRLYNIELQPETASLEALFDKQDEE